MPSLPIEFPIRMPENSGNMIHAQAPLKMFEKAVFHKNSSFKLSGEKSFKYFVNNTASHLIVTLANTLTIDKESDEKYYRFRKSLEQYSVPVIVFGFGIQSKERNIETANMSEEAIKLVEFLSSKANLLGVRGEYTKAVIEKCCNVNNVFVTGCPSLFSNPEGLKKLKDQWFDLTGKGAACVTNMAKEEEKKLLARAIKNKNFIIEPVSKFSHQYYLELQEGIDAELPYFLKSILKNGYSGLTSKEEIDAVYKSSYRLFRDTKTWDEFNKESLAYAYGTRFHVNMATILSGKPALWITHDARTRELVEFFRLPHLDLSQAIDMEYSEMLEYFDYTDFFQHIDFLFDNFNKYLSRNGLPKIKTLKDIT